jgi:cell division protein FtsB
MTKLIIIVLAALLLFLQYEFWFSQGGFLSVFHLRETVTHEQVAHQKLIELNDVLRAYIRDLKKGNEAVEERARTDLGMVGERETFYQVIHRKR